MTFNAEFRGNIGQEYSDYLRDESRCIGSAETISFPASGEELSSQLKKMREMKPSGGRTGAVTIQGARTGITAGAVPHGGHIINLSRMNKILGLRHAESGDEYLLTVQPGVLLSEIREAEKSQTKGKYFFPPDPTEVSASIGGMVACNASGARSFFYGPTRKYVERLRVVLADGTSINLQRGEQKAHGRSFCLETGSGGKIEGVLPSYKMPRVKNAAGYFTEDNMDLIDLFIGSEGTLGIISEIEIRLIPVPASVWGVSVFFPSEDPAIKFVIKMRSEPQTLKPVAIEFFDSHALDLLRKQKQINPAFEEIPSIPAGWNTAVYLEYHGNDEETVEKAVMEMSVTMAECGGDENATWTASNVRELERLKTFRHAIPEAVNLLIDERKKKEPGITKLGTDLAVPDASLMTILSLYHEDLGLAGLEYVIFGHIGDNHLHVNIIPATIEQYRTGEKLYLRWARTAAGTGGTVSAEHGIGKLKTRFLKEMYGVEGIRQMRKVKQCFDPDYMLNSGNMFDIE